MASAPKIPRSFGTHDGTFHADEVTACALLLLFGLIDADKIIRTRDPKKLEVCEFVCDVGGVYDPERKLFDHHQSNYTGPLSSAGMVLAYLKEKQVIQQHEYQFLNHSLIIGIDAQDNGKDPLPIGFSSFSNVVSNFVPIIHETDIETQNQAFRQALDFVLGHLHRLLNRYRYMLSCRELVAEAMSKNQECLMFDRGLPWLENFFELGGAQHPALFIIMPSGNHWKLRGIPPSLENRMQVRFPLPAEWAGLLESDLRKVSGITGAVFCHKGRFSSVWKTKEDAMKALKYTLNQGK